ncbi:MAG: bifunctional riboflavin kinase/FAD synthetase [Chitinophagaceae bacterium]|nr:bifunctional riboflavin kinase/FAD synthetase [Anaerolineae bacterium]
MKHIYDLANAQLEQPSIVTIGVFDGVHRGHAHLIGQLVDQAHTSGRLAVVLTFFPHPDIVLRGLKGRYYLTTAEQRAEQLLKLGVDCVVTHPFNEATRFIRAADFVDQLIARLRLDSLWVGADFALGYQREGNVDYLQAQGAEKGFSLHVIDLVQTGNDHEIISSTLIRELLEAGEVKKANHLLGRGYSVCGEIVHGEKRGRSIGFPTANAAVWEEQVIPENGVYAGWATLGDERFMAVTNIGIRPTFSGQDVTVEAHLLDFNREIYGQTLTVTFETRLRSEKKFNGIQELIAQIGADTEEGRKYLSINRP